MSSDPLRRLRSMGHDLSTTPISRLPKELERACFIVVNTYTSYSLSLGVAPLNDALSMAKLAKLRNLDIFFLHNPRKANFLKYLQRFLAITNDHLVVYYVGHGTRVRDLDGDEESGYDSAFVFDDGNIIDDVLVENLIKYKHPENQLTLITDACHSGSIWDIQSGNVNGRELPPMVMSISAASDAQTAKQTTVDRIDQGIFTYNLYKVVKADPEITPTNLKKKLTTVLRRYGQTCTIATTSPEIMNAVLFDSVDY